MPKSATPIFEPKPYYMTAIGMQGARFIEGGAVGGGSGKPGDEPKPNEGSSGAEKPEPPKPSEPEFKSPESKDAAMADLLKEREDRKRFQKEVTERDKQIGTLTESLTAKTNEVVERDATIAEKDAEIAVLKLATGHGIIEDEDIELLTSITDVAKREALAKRLATNNGTGVVRKSGTGSNASTTGGSIAEHRRQIAERKQK